MGPKSAGRLVRGSGVSVVFVLTPPALQSPPEATVAVPETEMPCGLLELLCTVQPTALKSVVPLKLIAPLTVLFRARTQAGGPGRARAATDRVPTSICGTCIRLIMVRSE